MRRRSRAASGPVKTRGRKTAKLKPRDAPKVASRRSSAGSQDAEVARLTREVTEALEQQTATSEVLNVISSSPGELEPVFQAILANATRICGANFGQMNLYAEGSFRPVAFYNAPAAYAAGTRRFNRTRKVVSALLPEPTKWSTSKIFEPCRRIWRAILPLLQ